MFEESNKTTGLGSPAAPLAAAPAPVAPARAPSAPYAPSARPLADSPLRVEAQGRETVEDIFGASEPVEAVPPNIASTVPEELSEKPGPVSRRLIIIIAVVIVAVGLAAWGIVSFFRSRALPTAAPAAPAGEQLPTAPAPATVPTPEAAQAPGTLPPDSDQDRLTDQEEAGLGTDPLNFDTDNDGLTDYEEAKVYKTNPLNPDTDADGFSDGQEVSGGFDPNKGGGARLLDLQAGINQLNSGR